MKGFCDFHHEWAIVPLLKQNILETHSLVSCDYLSREITSFENQYSYYSSPLIKQYIRIGMLEFVM